MAEDKKKEIDVTVTEKYLKEKLVFLYLRR